MNPFAQLSLAFRQQLAPQGPLEDTFVDEIIHAAWRLRHCAEDDDKSRNFAHRILRNSIAELRRLQTDRQIRQELHPEEHQTGLAGYRELHAARKTHAAVGKNENELEKANWVCSVKTNSAPASAAAQDSTVAQSAPPILHQTQQTMPKAA